MNISFLDVFAFMPPAQQGGEGDALSQMLPTLLMFGGIIFIFYFLILRPQKKRQQEHQQLVDNLKKGDKIVMSSGIHGKVADIDGNVLSIQIADNVQVKVDKASISSVGEKQ